MLFFSVGTQPAEYLGIFVFVTDAVHDDPVFSGLHRKKFSFVQPAGLLPQIHLPGFVYFFFSFSDKFHKACHIQIHFHRAAPVKDTFFFYDILIFRQSRLDQHLAQTEYRHTQVIAHICQFFSSKEIVKQLCSGDSCAPAVLHQTGM